MLTLRYRMLLPMALLVSLSGPGRSTTATEDNQPLRWNAPAERSECPVGDTAVWSRYAGGDDCIRYFAGGNVNNAALAMVFFRGDRVDWARQDPATVPRNSVRAQQAYAAHLSKRFGLPVIVIARPGTFGSSGDHFQRRQPSEFFALNKARLITIIGSPDDRLTPFRYQKEFADAVSALGHRVRLLEHAAPPPLYHSLDIVGMEAGAECARDKLHGKALDTQPPDAGPIKPQGTQ